MYTGEHLMVSEAHSDYNVTIQFGAVGKLDVEALKKALAFLWRRHQVLRTALISQVPQFPDLFLMAVTEMLYDSYLRRERQVRAVSSRSFTLLKSQEVPFHWKFGIALMAGRTLGLTQQQITLLP
ncbi:MAG: hypothetical protein GY746_11035 [Gammaproteobacteria bacterium]|nr:hypothetical protein [Gammaproteobacteria bacterium]